MSMHPHRLTRRALLGASLTALARPQSAASPLTAEAVVQRIKSNVGVPWRDQTVDRIVAGSPDIQVQGIATTMMATLDVFQRAQAAGLNLIITHEPTYYSHQDTTEPFTSDPTYGFKAEFLRKHKMAAFRFHDHWHARKPDGIAFGMMRELGWEKYVDAQHPRQFHLPSTSLADFAKEMQTKLKIRTMRVIGDPRLTIKNAAASWGYASQFPVTTLFAQPDVDVFIVGETREWEIVEYAQDAISAGAKKALIVLGHVVSEQAGMKYCAEWLKTFIPEVPVQFVQAVEPFWSPDRPVSPGG